MAPVPFQNIPNNLRTPFFFAEVSNRNANTAGQNQRGLIIGQMTTGSATPNIPVISYGGSSAGASQCGVGSQIDLMNQAWRANDPFGEMWFLPLADAGGAVAAAGAITLTGGPTTATGVYSLYIAGILIQATVASGSTITAAATAIAAAINATPSVPVTASPAAGVVTVTAINKGAAGNDIDIRFNYGGASAGQALPAGITVGITPMSGGATNPVLTTGLANLAAMPFDFIASAYTDSVSIAALTAFMNDTAGRWSWQSGIYGGIFMAYRGTYGALGTFGATLNDQHTSCMGFYDSPSPVWQWAAAYAAAVSVSVRADPAQPLHTLGLLGILPPPLASRFSNAQQNSLLYDGISTFDVDQSGAISINLGITTYQLNSFGQPDNSYLKVETMTTLTTVLRQLAGVVTSKFARMKLADNGTRFAPGSNIVTPNIVRAQIVATYREMEFNGLVQDSATFAANLVVQRNATDPNRLDVIWPGILINQLDVFALLAQFQLAA